MSKKHEANWANVVMEDKSVVRVPANRKARRYYRKMTGQLMPVMVMPIRKYTDRKVQRARKAAV
jgi:hypothetical protein